MIRFRNILVFAVLALWLPAANHCRLEQIPGLGFLSCCTHEDAAETHHEDDCQTDSCATVEAGLYKSEGNRVFVAMPAVILVGLLPAPLDGLANPGVRQPCPAGRCAP